ncbi:hypothetical protein [Nonomuraea angiospora]|uniref:hypothetical protein n=1 Tax=Nonomuraea angiospora TaxID=46172 RepID=UPI0029B40DB3|nr:hypothetical protein [Nonomuraea angiospora]MDX3099693.1 hypothetical protein [Nonomuraea angiospora]
MSTYPGLNGGVVHPRPGDGQRGDIPCTCELVELTVRIPGYIRDQLVTESARNGNTVDDTVAAAFQHFQTGPDAPIDPCRTIK